MFFCKKINPDTFKVILVFNGKIQTFHQALNFMKHSPLIFQNDLKQCVIDSNFKSIFIEFPCLTNLMEKFEFVIINAVQMENIIPNSSSFKINHNNNNNIIITKSLSMDTTLIIPNINSKNNYADIYNFLDPNNNNLVDIDIISKFWENTASQIILELNSKKKIWISTSGLAVHWLHLRISESPKYYNHEPYKFLY